MIESVTTTVTLSVDDYLSGQRDFLRHRLGFRIGRLVILGLPVLALIVWAVERRLPHPVEIFPVVLLLLFPVFWRPLMRVSIRRNLNQNPSARGPQRYVISPEGISLTGSVHNTSLSWPAIVRVRITDQNTLFYISDAFCYFLPRHATTAGDLEVISDLAVSNHVPFQRLTRSA